MLRKLRPRRPSHGTVVAYLALFFALGGSAYAAFVVSSNSQIGPDTIYGANKPASANDNVVNGSLTGADIRGNASPGFINGSLDTYDIRDAGLLGGDLAANTVTAGQLAPDSASTSEIKDGSVTNAKLAPGKVPDADNLDGKDSSLFLQGQGKIENSAHAIPRGGFAYLEDPPTSGWLRLTYYCPTNPAAQGQISMRNNSGAG